MADLDARQRRIMDHLRRTTDINFQRTSSDRDARKQRILEHIRRSLG
ncbi:MAG: hypothetical protein NZL92_04155 [Gloeomargarita sp. SKYG116]|nr:hypothetical protein [Gloeomargarita sp. SKYG116]MCS7225625.1 hypothetical protein [Gloeomargarita sp. SKYB31]MDW8400872.1 hypothetical protein [Gloeomargarita sp. SKYGB_i_bin116]